MQATLIALVGLCGACGSVAHAQRIQPEIPSFQPPPFPHADIPAAATRSGWSTAPASWVSYWREGAVIGGAATGLLTAYVLVGLCNDPDSNTRGGSCVLPGIGGFLMGAVPGAVLGAFIGNTIPKHRPQHTP